MSNSDFSRNKPYHTRIEPDYGIENIGLFFQLVLAMELSQDPNKTFEWNLHLCLSVSGLTWVKSAEWENLAVFLWFRKYKSFEIRPFSSLYLVRKPLTRGQKRFLRIFSPLIGSIFVLRGFRE